MKKRLKNKIINKLIKRYMIYIATHNSKITKLPRYKCKYNIKLQKKKYKWMLNIKNGHTIYVTFPIYNSVVVNNIKPRYLQYYKHKILVGLNFNCDKYNGYNIECSPINPNHDNVEQINNETLQSLV